MKFKVKQSFLFVLFLSSIILVNCSDDNGTNPGNDDESHIVWEGEWLKFSAYLSSVEFVKENYPTRANDRFSTNSQYCDYSGDNPAGRAGFYFEDQGDSTYLVRGYTFEYNFGASGYVWGSAQGTPTENTYAYNCTLHYEGEGQWSLEQINLILAGNYIRDTRHD